jgi:small nuclear ribonucleoprotein (snRNP)-like protein
LGSYLSLITKAESRYEGTLVEVDRIKKTMSLKDVKNMGTEGRRNGVNELPQSEGLLGMVKFRVDLIRTFEIIKK